LPLKINNGKKRRAAKYKKGETKENETEIKRNKINPGKANINEDRHASLIYARSLLVY